MRCCFQLLDTSNGTRSPSMTATRTEFANELKKLTPEQRENTMVIPVAETLGDDDQWRMSTAPLFQVQNFIDCFADGVIDERQKIQAAAD